MATEQLHIVFVGGGTGGHVLPIVSLIEYAQNHSEIAHKCKQVYWFGENNSLEEAAAKKLSGVIFIPVWAGKMRRYRDIRSFFHNIIDMVKVFGAFFQSCYFLVKYKVDVVFCKGGYVALPVCLAAKLLRKRIILHESDMHPGLTNRIVAKVADTIFTGFPGTFPHEQVVGQILSSHLAVYNTPIDDTKTHILVMGGSQGAQALLSFVHTSTQIFDSMSVHITVILGTKNGDWREKLSGYDYITLYDYIDQATLASVYAQTDIAVTRAGVTSLAEQQLFGIKKIIVPHLYGGGYHQLKNALWYSATYGDIVVEEDEQLYDNLHMFLKKLIPWKKAWKELDVETIEKSKQDIWQSLIR